MTARTISAALCAIALMRCGGDGSGGTNGPTGDGGELPGIGDGKAPGGDGHVPNQEHPLNGVWVATIVDDQPSATCACTEVVTPSTPVWLCSCAAYVTVDPTDPDCSQALQRIGSDWSMGPPGDACITKRINVQEPVFLILDGDVVRRDATQDCALGCSCRRTACYRVRGSVTDGGTRIEYTLERVDLGTTTAQAIEKVR